MLISTFFKMINNTNIAQTLLISTSPRIIFRSSNPDGTENRGARLISMPIKCWNNTCENSPAKAMKTICVYIQEHQYCLQRILIFSQRRTSTSTLFAMYKMRYKTRCKLRKLTSAPRKIPSIFSQSPYISAAHRAKN